jgi:peptidylprolyl isomerase
MLRKFCLAMIAVFLGMGAAFAADDAKANDKDWRDVDPANLVLMDVRYGTIAIELAPEFAPANAARFKALVRAGFYDNTNFYRVIDGFVAQGGKGGAAFKEWPPIKGEMDRPATGLNFTPLGARDLYAPQVGNVDGFPVGEEKGRAWILHCPGTIAFARDKTADSAATEFYIVLGEGARQLDRNYTAFGRVIDGMQYVQKLNRGDENVDNGVIPLVSRRDPIIRVRMASDVPLIQRPHYQVLRTDTARFAAAKDARMHPNSPYLVRKPPAALDVCTMPIPVRTVAH